MIGPRHIAPLVLLSLALGGCNEGHPELLNPNADLAARGDLPDPSDMPQSGDLKMGPSCGQIVLCVVQCGVTNLACSQTCFQGAQPSALQQSGALVLCAATNCLAGGGGDGGAGGGGMLAIFACLSSKCSDEVGKCEGLPFGGI